METDQISRATLPLRLHRTVSFVLGRDVECHANQGRVLPHNTTAHLPHTARRRYPEEIGRLPLLEIAEQDAWL